MSFSISRPLLWGGHCQFEMFIVDDGICFVISFHGGWSKTCHFFIIMRLTDTISSELNTLPLLETCNDACAFRKHNHWTLNLVIELSLSFVFNFFRNPEQFGATGHCLCKWCYHGYPISPGYVSEICSFISFLVIKQNLTLNSIF